MTALQARLRVRAHLQRLRPQDLWVGPQKTGEPVTHHLVLKVTRLRELGQAEPAQRGRLLIAIGKFYKEGAGGVVGVLVQQVVPGARIDSVPACQEPVAGRCVRKRQPRENQQLGITQPYACGAFRVPRVLNWERLTAKLGCCKRGHNVIQSVFK